MSSKKPLAIRMILWFIRNYKEAKGAWIGFNWCLAITLFIIGAFKGYDFQKTVLGMLLIGLILNIGLYLIIRTAQSYLKSLPEGPDKEEIHDTMIKFLIARLKH